MAHNYYRSSAPSTWGTSNYRFGYPPEPLFRPQHTCEFHSIPTSRRRSRNTHPARHSRGRARLLSGSLHEPRSVSETHGYLNPYVNPVARESTLYHRIREGLYDAEGVGLHEARHWHRQAYGGFGDIRTLSPRDIGHAAAYEAYRIWIHNRTISDLRSDFGQRREAFVALAIAEGW